jgi:hypothetical protein
MAWALSGSENKSYQIVARKYKTFYICGEPNTEAMKKVYVTFEKDGYGNDAIDCVFKSKTAAITYVWKTKLSGRSLRPPSPSIEEFRRIAMDYIEVHNVIKTQKP